jgi:iron complex outermembrane receptor protein
LTYIDQFADRTIGVALGFVRADGTTNEIGTGGWGGQSNATATLTDGTVLTGVQIPGPWGNGLDYKNRRLTDERSGVAAILEYKPNKNFTSQVDFYKGKVKTDAHEARIQGGMPNSITNATVVNGVATKGTFSFNGGLNGLIDRTESVFDDDTISSIGWKNTFKFGDGWTGVLDLSRNSAKRIERDIEAYAGIPGPDTLTFDATGGGTPKFTLGNPTAYTDPTVIKIRDQTGWSGVNYPASIDPSQGPVPQAGYSKGPTLTDKLSAIRFDLSHAMPEGSMFSDVQFGGNFAKRTKDRVTNEGVIISDGNLGRDPIAFPSGAYVEKNIGGTGLDMLTFDPTADLWPGARILPKYNDDILSKSYGIEEKVTTVYSKFNIDTQMANIPVRGNLGVQLVKTDQSSTGYRADIGSGVVLDNPAGALSRAGTKYNNFLPSLNLAGDLGNGNVMRFAASEQLARGTLTDLRNSFAASENLNESDGTYGLLIGSAGNPALKPFKAKALDLSYEKYFGKKAYLSAAVFYKRLDTYIVPETNLAYDFTKYATELGIAMPHSGTYTGIFTTSVNGSGGNLKGYELTASAPFNVLSDWLDGFGLTGSISSTTSSVRLPDIIGANPNQQIPGNGGTISLPGLSKINNKLMVYFEKWGFSAFVAQNFRTDYVGSVANDATGGYPTLRYIQGSKWVSAQLGYEVQEGYLKGLGVRVEGNNLNNPVYRQLKADGTTDSENKTGHTVIVRVNYKFQ